MDWRDVPSPIDGIKVQVRDATEEDREHAKRYLMGRVETFSFLAAYGPEKRRLCIAVHEKHPDDAAIVADCLPLLRSFAEECFANSEAAA